LTASDRPQNIRGMFAQVCPAPGAGFAAAGSVIVLLAAAGLLLLLAWVIGRVAWRGRRARPEDPRA
jgi:hypothetical protein